MPVIQRKATQSIARMQFVTAESALKAAVRAERERFRAPISEQYKTYLHGLASEGDDQALAELRKMSSATSYQDLPEVGSIAPVGGGTEPNAVFYRGKQVRYLVHRNGDVVYSLAGRAIIQDKGDKLLMLQTDRLAIETALRLAHVKFGDVLTVSGPRDFQERTARIAAEAGVQVTFQDHKLEKIRQHSASELASERAKRAEHRELGSKFIDQQRRSSPTAPEVPKKIEAATPGPEGKDKGRDR